MFILQALSKNRKDTVLNYGQLLKTHNLNNNEQITETIAFHEDEYYQEIRRTSEDKYIINLVKNKPAKEIIEDDLKFIEKKPKRIEENEEFVEEENE